MRIISADDLAGIFHFPAVVEALRHAFERGVVLPPRHHHSVSIVGEPAATLLLMPAWDHPEAMSSSGFLGVKIVTIYPGNAARDRASVNGVYVLMEGSSGELLAIIDGRMLTLWRTAAASALAASFLARPDANRLVMVGAGALAPFMIRAHASVTPIESVLVWNRTRERASKVASDLAGESFSIAQTDNLEAAVRSADIISCATLSHEPLVRGRWLKAGAHVDLVGAFTPQMREADDETIGRSRLYVDTRDALKEAGDLIHPLQAGVEVDIVGDLFDLCGDAVAGRRSDGEITVFKSVGTALEDLAAATLAYSLSTGVNPAGGEPKSV